MKKLTVLVLFLTILACSQQKEEASAETETQDMMEQLENMTPETHDAVMETMLGKPNYDIKSIGILVYDGVNDLDVMGPRYVLGQTMGASTKLISVEPGNIKTVMGVEMVPDATVDDIDQLDILVIPGGFRGTIEAAYDDELHAWIRKIDESAIFTAAVCTGGWILGATGLLEGKRASTNWYREEEFLTKYGAIPANERFTRDGKYWTSAGVTAGMDMSLAILIEIFGEEYAQGVMLDMEYDPAPPIAGGSPETTSTEVNIMMQAMYDMGIQPLIDSLEAVN
ncbi:MAG: DJ-1/PfpI family protein [Balneolales bacterium]|nr:DJ-1/PfpI family protein [Balneolales bacterium]